MKRTKVFGIGFHKTGTTSLAHALRTLSYDVAGPNGVNDPNIRENLDNLVETVSVRFDAFRDNPWPIVFKKMDDMHPGSKFILTIRDPDHWIRSLVAHFETRTTPMRELIYGVGSPAGNEEIFKRRLLAHNAEVIDYFKHRPDDLLVIDITRDGAWEPICRFLGEPVPAIPFPYANRAEDREAQRTAPRRLIRTLRWVYHRTRRVNSTPPAS